MRQTPEPLPDFITRYRHPPWKNIYEICKNEPFVFGTESLYGDWDAELLIIAQDAGPAEAFERLRKSGHEHPFAHREWRPGYPNYDPTAGTGGASTNEIVYRLAEHLVCAKLYGSALIGMCRPGVQYGSKLSVPTGLRLHCVRVLRWVFDPVQTPSLRAAICLGGIASDVVHRVLHETETATRPIRVFRTPHPAARDRSGKYEAVLPTWREMGEDLGLEFIEDPSNCQQ